MGRFAPPIIALIIVCTIGILGLMIIDDYPFLDAIYQTIFTISTVGYQETHPLSTAGRMFVTVLIICGVSVWTYAFSVTISVVINDDLVRFGKPLWKTVSAPSRITSLSPGTPTSPVR
ncbi:MAG: two pore domain potassium channel family protein [Magnetococcales bacterium]|nr:two pore domain potassium channel family protein [Magnetococcales bacterium]